MSIETHPAVLLLAARPELFARCGSINPDWQCRNGTAYGPYYRLYYRENGRRRDVYLGREGPLVQRVRLLLHTLQYPFRQRRACNRIDRQLRAELRANNARLNGLLRPLGLRLKGFEIRGWRNSLLGNSRMLDASTNRRIQ